MVEVIPPRRDEALTPEGIPTLRFSEYLERITSQSNATENILVSSIDNIALALVFALEERIGSGDFLTSDETGFTVESINLSVDMDEA